MSVTKVHSVGRIWGTWDCR